jgi:uncharacterized surface protein with fasciclin (FAS1) repeats|tara:strand:- start:1713 stop:2129 length:417 start_codon:yes stop_codon:yes gene_type:complete
MGDILETASSVGSFKKFIEAIELAGLGKSLNNKTDFTLFAPTDRAFEKLPKRVYRRLMEDKQKLREILKYHILPKKMMFTEVASMACENTLQGSQLCIDTSIGVSAVNTKIGNANIVVNDIMCSNGVIHAIDNVLLPN